jgi:hypothetical protein
MGIAQNYLGAHINQFIHKKQPAFKHFLVDKHGSFGLGSGY